MPAARESLLDAAYTSLARRPWSAVRMVDVAAAAGVSRQTLYNEFGSKEGLARALVRREADAYLAGVAVRGERAFDPGEVAVRLPSHQRPGEPLLAAELVVEGLPGHSGGRGDVHHPYGGPRSARQRRVRGVQ